MAKLKWEHWFRSEGCRYHMDRVSFAGVNFSSIFWSGMKKVFADQNGNPGLLYRRELGPIAAKIVEMNGTRYRFSSVDQERYFEHGEFIFSKSNTLTIEGPDLPEHNNFWAMGACPGNLVEINFYRILADARSGFGGFLPRFPENEEGVDMLAYFVGATMLHEIMHNHGFSHPERVNWTPGTAYASSLPHVAALAVLMASPYREYFERLIGIDVELACCGTAEPFTGKPYSILAGGTWSTGWTHLMPFTLNKEQLFIIYNKHTGEVHFDRVLPDGRGSTTIGEPDWSSGWSHLMPFYIDNHPYFIIYNQSTGLVHFDRINNDGRGSTTIDKPDWSSGWTHLVPFNRGDQPNFIIYNASTGLVHFDQIKSDGRGSITIGKPDWSSGWTHLMPYKKAGWPFLIKYNSIDGAVEFHSIFASGKGSKKEDEATWGTGWTHLMPMAKAGVADYLAYNATNGVVHFDIATDNGWATVSDDTWSGGWSLLEPAMLKGTPGFIAYNKSNGNVHFDKTF